MSKVLCEYNDLKNVANAIREKSNTNDEYLVSQLANAISTIPTSLGVACGLYFSQAGVTDTIYYTNEKGESCTYDVSNGPSQLSVLKDSLIVSKNGHFTEDTYIINNGSEVINRYAIKIKTATIINYADGAPV